MSQKRMFDRAIIDTDRFMDLGLPSKALYFLLGMEADDEGFVSYKKVMRIHGGNEDDIKVLIVKSFIIKFQSGVVVITDWNKNNWLDSRRIKKTEYQQEKKMLVLNPDKTYCLANAKQMLREYSIEESSIEESRERETDDKSSILLKWNNKKNIRHKRFDKDWDKYLKALLKDFQLEEILKAIETYTEVLADDKYRWDYRWTLGEFLRQKNACRVFVYKTKEDYLIKDNQRSEQKTICYHK